jgi:hypothetical protein
MQSGSGAWDGCSDLWDRGACRDALRLPPIFLGWYRFMPCHILSIIGTLEFLYVNLLHLKH